MEYSFLALQFFCVVVFRESNGYVEFFTDVLAHDLFFKTGDELAGAQLQFVAFCLAAGKSNTVNSAFEVDVGNVFHGGCTVSDFDHTGVAGLYVRQFVGYFFIGSFHDGAGYFQTQIVCDVCVGLGIEGSGQHNAVFVDGFHIEFGLAYDHLVKIGDSFGISGGDHFVDGVFIENFLAVHLFHDSAGCLALTETGDGDVLHRLSVNLVDSGFKSCVVYIKSDFILIDSNVFGILQAHGFCSSK